jgi:NAD(P)-dependent dehydrogenase (short-subunit alcohol dehydrogenase family)
VSPALQDRVAIVTGAATGIGKAIALALGRAGAKVVVNHLDTRDPADGVVSEITRSGGEAIAAHFPGR